MRTIAIANENKSSNIKQIVDEFNKSSSYDNIVVFTKDSVRAKNDISCSIDVEVVEAPEDVDVSTTPKFRNWILRESKQKFSDWLHVIDDSIEILKDPTQFMNDVEHMMETLDINNYFGTITDGCNKVYSKYNPRLKIALDADDYRSFGFGDALLFCSHSNIQWITYNLSKADDNELFFDEKFTIDMFFIIEFLARRRNSHPDQLYFMNQYATCQSEYGLYDFKKGLDREPISNVQEKMRSEDAIFKSMGINYSPDNNIDNLLEKVYMKLKSKIKK